MDMATDMATVIMEAGAADMVVTEAMEDTVCFALFRFRTGATDKYYFILQSRM